MEHILRDSNKSAWQDDPWISTTTDLEVARGFDQGNGIIAIDLDKVSSEKVYQFENYSMDGDTNEKIAYQRAVWSREVSIYQYIEREAIIGYVK
ncbi:hypothetical protein VQL36_03945 [Chengkuizengella sp. SCS-71B]|uniref:DUF7587 domain-containing protein n=1 Tax=Chengkuizengella sp. SCS-71B TaxID=3115290 RepID=UPI0032C23D0A